MDPTIRQPKKTAAKMNEGQVLQNAEGETGARKARKRIRAAEAKRPPSAEFMQQQRQYLLEGCSIEELAARVQLKSKCKKPSVARQLYLKQKKQLKNQAKNSSLAGKMKHRARVLLQEQKRTKLLKSLAANIAGTEVRLWKDSFRTSLPETRTARPP